MKLVYKEAQERPGLPKPPTVLARGGVAQPAFLPILNEDIEI
jgi:hypothetical protein